MIRRRLYAKCILPAETIAQGREDLAERDEDARLEAKYGDHTDHDMNMNF